MRIITNLDGPNKYLGRLCVAKIITKSNVDLSFDKSLKII